MSVIKQAPGRHSGDVQIPPALDVRQIFLTNIKLLGFNTAAHEAALRIPFNKDMFTRPNKAGSEAVLHFLFERLNPVLCREEFRDCWPIKSKKEEAQFRKVCNSWLTNIQKEEPDSNLTRVPASMLLSPGGDKFYELLGDFSTYVLLLVIRKECGHHDKDMIHFPPLNRQNLPLHDVTARMLQCGAIRHRQRFLDHLQTSIKAEQQRSYHFNELVKEDRKLTKLIRDLEREVRELQQISVEKDAARGSPSRKKRNSSAFDLDSRSVRRAQRLHKVQDMWRQVSDYSKVTRERKIIESILDETLQKYEIDCAEFNVRVPDLLLRECEEEIHRRHVDNIYEGGKLNLVSVIQLWNLSLHLYIERLHQAGVPNFENEVGKVTSQVHTHQAYLANAEAFRLQLSTDILPALKSSIAQLRQQWKEEAGERKTPESKMLGFSLVTPSPTMSFTPAERSVGGKVSVTALQQHSETISTPEAAVDIMETVAQSARKGSRRLFQGTPVYAPKIAMQSHALTESRLVSTQGPGVGVDRRISSLKSKVKLTQPINKTRGPGTLRQRKVPVKQVSSVTTEKKKHPVITDSVNVSATDARCRLANTSTVDKCSLPTGRSREADHHTASTLLGTSHSQQFVSQQHKPVRRDSLDDRTTPSRHQAAKTVNEQSTKVMSSKLQAFSSHHSTLSKQSASVKPQCLTPSQIVRPKSHDILADKIVSAVMQQEADLKAEVARLEESLRQFGLSPPDISTLTDINLENPVAALSEEAFVSKDRIPRSPLEPELRRLFQEARAEHDQHKNSARKQLSMPEVDPVQTVEASAISPQSSREHSMEDIGDTTLHREPYSNHQCETTQKQTHTTLENEQFPDWDFLAVNSDMKIIEIPENNSFHENMDVLKSEYDLENEEFPVQSDNEVENEELSDKSDNEVDKEEFPVKSDDEFENEEFSVKSDYELENEELPVKSDYELENEEFPVKSDYELENEELPVKSDYELENEEFPVKSDYELENEEFPAADEGLETGVGVQQSDSEGDDYLTPDLNLSPGVDDLLGSGDNLLAEQERAISRQNNSRLKVVSPENRSHPKSALSTHSADSPVRTDNTSLRNVDSSFQSPFLSSLDELFAAKSSQFINNKKNDTSWSLSSNPFSVKSSLTDNLRKIPFPQETSSASLISLSPFVPKLSAAHSPSASVRTMTHLGQSVLDFSLHSDVETSDGPLSLDDSFVPLRDGFLLDGKSPARLRPSDSGDGEDRDHVSRMMRLKSRAAQLIQGVETERVVCESDLHLSSCSSDDRFIDKLSEKYLHKETNGNQYPVTTQQQQQPSSL
ncbi:uncharacterized protein LOC121383147 [Gigantopelta aegis]|uniref:uncharacterized protein LOC121383147 n=1 Tax=Gigantopelta aegis TaxID=1735272 RepID=UPI001B88DE1A|nr:uncharacterized protein LOC121383147 [Gigantopelta aegis]